MTQMPLGKGRLCEKKGVTDVSMVNQTVFEAQSQTMVKLRIYAYVVEILF